MLWVNLIMDTFAALALATEPPSDKLLDRLPEGKKDPIMSPSMMRNIIGQSIYQIVVLLLLLFLGPSMFFDSQTSLEEFHSQETYNLVDGKTDFTEKGVLYTIVFQTFVFMQLFNQINARKIGENEFNVFANFFNNWLFIGIWLVTIGVQILIVEIGGIAFECDPLDVKQTLICAAIGAGSLPWNLIIKIVPVRFCSCFKMNEEEMTDEQDEASITSSMRKSFRKSITRKMTDSRRQQS